jgi:hypothetical protein
LHGVNIPSGSTLKITSKIGNLTGYTQQYEQMARVSLVATPDSENGQATPHFIPNAPFPSLDTAVDGVLDAGRVEIVNGSLSGTGTVQGAVSVFGPVGGYADPIESKEDPGWDNKNYSIKGTDGGFLVAGEPGATPGGGAPGKLTVTGDVSLFGASFVAYAKAAGTQGSDYSWLSGGGKVDLGNSTLDLSLIGYTPQAGDSLTIVTAANGITGKFSQGDGITVNGFRFNITYNAKSVVLTYVPLAGLGAVPPVSEPPPPLTPNEAFVARAYQELAGQPADPPTVAHWASVLGQGASRLAVVRQLERLPASREHLIEGLYRILLRRGPGPTELARDLRFLGRRGRVQKLAARLLASPEYFRVRGGGTPAAFLAALARDVLRRRALPALLPAGDPAALMNAGGRRALVDRVLRTSAAGRTEAKDLYRMVDLSATGRELRDAAALLDLGRTDEAVLARIVASAASRNDRAGSVWPRASAGASRSQKLAAIPVSPRRAPGSRRPAPSRTAPVPPAAPPPGAAAAGRAVPAAAPPPCPPRRAGSPRRSGSRCRRRCR